MHCTSLSVGLRCLGMTTLSHVHIMSAHTTHYRAGEILGGFWNQTPSLSLTQNVNAYQFLGPQDIVLPRPESFEVGSLILMAYFEAFRSW